MTDTAKAAVWDAVFLPWGGVHAISGSATLDARFPGQWFQLESGLHYNWHRQYDPTIGRYVQADPLGFVDGPSVYGYARSTPQRFVDPEGRNALCAPAGPWGVAACAAAPIVARAVLRYCVQSWQPADPGNCTPDEHRDLQDRADNACKPARCVQADKITDLNSKISINSGCIHAQKRINDRCYSGGDSAHKKSIEDRVKAIDRCKEYFKHYGGVK